MLLEAILAGLLVGIVRGGKLSNLSSAKLSFSSLLILAMTTQSLAFIPAVQQELGPWTFLLIYSSYLMILTALSFNFKHRYLQGVFVGTAMNFIVIIANRGMPVDTRFMEALFGQTFEMTPDILHVPSTDSTNFWFLGDNIPLPPPYPMPGLISLGDVVLMISVFLFLQSIMLMREHAASFDERSEIGASKNGGSAAI